LAAASLGQAHAATLEDGTEVVVKVRRPGVVEQIDVDLKLLRRLATIAHSRSDTARRWDLLGLCTEFETLLRAELDYVTEARNAERFARNFGQPMSTVRIPRIFWNSTTTEVLTLERMHGLRGTDVAGLDAAGIDRSHLAEQTADMVVKMLLVDRFFHADLHPGNLFVQPDGRIALIDFGEVGTLDEPTHAALAQIVLALIQQDPERLTSAIVALQPTSDAADHHALMQDVKVLLGLTGADAAAGKHRRQFGAVINEVLTIMRRHRLVLPSSMALVLKTLAMLESIAEQLDPSFEFMDVFLPYARQFMLDYYSPRRLIERARKTAADVWWISTELPGHVRQLISSLEDGSFKMIVQPSGMEALVVRAERLIDRLVLGIIVAALINGGAVLLSASQQPGAAQAVGALLNIGAFAVLGLGLALTWGMVRSVGRR
jgi:ubiquinone biosynthesis protein